MSNDILVKIFESDHKIKDTIVSIIKFYITKNSHQLTKYCDQTIEIPFGEMLDYLEDYTDQKYKNTNNVI